MAKKSMVNRNEKRKKLVARKLIVRRELKESLRLLHAKMLDVNENHDVVAHEIEELRLKLDALPRNSSQIRVGNRCHETGRPRGYLRKFGLCRNMVRLYTIMGLVPGLRKASW